jgi:hypothetical protein
LIPFFYFVVEGRFIRDFCDFWCFGVVFLWPRCGAMCGKDGFRTDAFRAPEILQFCGIYFSTGLGGSPKQAA